MAGWTRELPGTRVALVLCQSRDAVASFFDAEPTPFEVLVDDTRDVAKAYGVYVLLGFESINIARPATFVIGPDRVIRYIFVASHQREVPEDVLVREAVGRAAAT